MCVCLCDYYSLLAETGLIKTRRDTAGKNDVVNDPCKRCEEKKNEAVCGNNRKTYNSLCHAVNCADLQVEDVREGPCETKVRDKIDFCINFLLSTLKN